MHPSSLLFSSGWLRLLLQSTEVVLACNSRPSRRRSILWRRIGKPCMTRSTRSCRLLSLLVLKKMHSVPYRIAWSWSLIGWMHSRRRWKIPWRSTYWPWQIPLSPCGSLMVQGRLHLECWWGEVWGFVTRGHPHYRDIVRWHWPVKQSANT